MKARIWSVFVWGVLPAMPWGADAPPASGEEEARQAIAKQVARINEAWRSDNGAEIMRSVLSDSFTVSLPDPGNPGFWHTMDKETFCAVFAQMLRDRRPEKHVRQTTKITIQNGIAFENGISLHMAGQVTKRDQILNFWRREKDSWRLFFTAMAPDLRKAMRKR